VRKLVGGEGKGVGEHEEVEGNLWVCSVGAGAAGVVLPAMGRSSSEMRAVGCGGLARHPGCYITDFPLAGILHSRDSTGRISKWQWN
jgi:hypothetical protein